MVTIRIINEDEASQSAKAIYEDIRVSLGMPWVGIIIKAFASYFEFLRHGWTQMKPSVLTAWFERSADDIKTLAICLMRTMQPISNHVNVLRRLGYSNNQVEEINQVVEVLNYGNTKLLIFAAALGESLDNGKIPGNSYYADKWTIRPKYASLDRLEMIEESQATGELLDVYEDIKKTLDLPFVNSDYKALAKWHGYLPIAWKDLKPKVMSEDYRLNYEALSTYASHIARNLPRGFRIDQNILVALGYNANQISEIKETVGLFRRLLPGLILNVAAFKLALNPELCLIRRKVLG